MGELVLPFSGGAYDEDVVFDVSSDGGGGTAVQGRGSGDRGGYGGVGVAGTAVSGGVGVFGKVEGVDRDGDPGTGVYGEADRGVGVFGTANGSWGDGLAAGVAGLGPIGVKGISFAPGEPGVFGVNDAGVGVYGESASGFAMRAEGHVTQRRDKGGWVKAMVRVTHSDDPESPIRVIQHCFNSQPNAGGGGGQPCGFQLARVDRGVYIIDFGFSVSDRFISVTAESRPSGVNPLDPGTTVPSYDPFSTNFVVANVSIPSPNQIMVVTYIALGDIAHQQVRGFLPTDANFYLVVF